MRRFFPFLFLLGVAVIAACGGGGGSAGAPAQPKVPNGSTSASVKVFVPSKTAQAKRPQAIVAGTQSVRIRIYTVGGATPVPQPADTIAVIGPTAPGCSAVNGGTQCTIVVTGVPISPAVVFEILSYASTDGSGTPLASGFVTVDTTQATITPPPVALGGVVNTLVLSPVAIATSVPSTSLQTYTFTVTAKDAGGNIILPPGTFSPSIFFAASNDPNGSISFSPNPLVNPDASGANTITLTYDPKKTFMGAATVTATADKVSAKLTFAPTGSGGGGFTAGYRIFEYTIPTARANPWQITTGPNKSLWFTEHGTDKFGEFFPASCTQSTTPTCTMLEGHLGTPTSPTGISEGHDGNMWIGGDLTNAPNHVWTIQTSNSTCAAATQSSLSGCVQVAQSPDPNPSMSAYDVRAGTDNLMHVAATTGIGPYILNYWPVMSPAVTYNAFVSPGSAPFGLDASGYFTDPGSGSIGVFQCAEGCTTSTYTFAAGGVPEGIVKGPSGDVFVADTGNNAIQYFDPSTCSTTCTYNQIPIPTASSGPMFLAAGADGNIWFTESNANKIGVVVVNTMSVYEIPIPTANAGPWGITLGPDGNIWFTENTAGKIGVIVP